jgi:cytochrome c553
MRMYSLTISCLLFLSCNQQTQKNADLQKHIDSLEIQIAQTYKPGFGEFMSSIQIHHAKLWFAGKNQNWKLADFEVNEIKENLEGIQKYCSDRTESKSIGMINQAMDSISAAIQQKNQNSFREKYIDLTNTCNKCHEETQHEYNVVKIPEIPPFSNQDFKANE